MDKFEEIQQRTKQGKEATKTMETCMQHGTPWRLHPLATFIKEASKEQLQPPQPTIAS